jgi:hypothetical protein
MNLRRLSLPPVVLGAWLAAVPPAGAHRLDEYLQATRLSIDIEHVDLEIDLTAGAALASNVFAWIDTNRDGEISRAEGEVYARLMLRSVVLKIDGCPVPVTLTGTSFPQFRDMSLGVGTIRLRATAKVPSEGAGRHQVSFLNTHQPESSVYLVNALVPANPRIQLGDPRRDQAQHSLKLGYTVKADAPSPLERTFAPLARSVMIGWLLWRFGFALTQAVAHRQRPSRPGAPDSSRT